MLNFAIVDILVDHLKDTACLGTCVITALSSSANLTLAPGTLYSLCHGFILSLPQESTNGTAEPNAMVRYVLHWHLVSRVLIMARPRHPHVPYGATGAMFPCAQYSLQW